MGRQPSVLRLLPLLVAAAAALAVAPTQSQSVSAPPAPCRAYISKGLIQPATESLQDVIVVQDAFVVGDTYVTLDVSHRRVGALKITLAAQPFSSLSGSASHSHPQIILKSHGLGRLGDNLYRTTFNDQAPTAFPVNASFAPFTGTYRPVQKLAFLTDGDLSVAGAGGSQGLWTLTIADVAPNNTRREIALNGWTLTLCERSATPATPSPSPSPAPSPAPASPQPQVPAGDQSTGSTPATPTPSPFPSPSPAPTTVTGFDGPTGGSATTTGGSTASSGSTTGSTTTGGGAASAGTVDAGRTWMGWKVVYADTPTNGQAASNTNANTNTASGTAGAGANAGAGAGAGFGFGSGLAALNFTQPLQSLLEQRPVLSMLQQQVSTLAAGAGLGGTGTCDEACQQAKQTLWRAVFFRLYMRAVFNAHKVPGEESHAWLQKLQAFLPGDNKLLGRMHDWLDSHSDNMDRLGSWLHTHMRVPALANGTLHLHKPSGSLLHHLTSTFAAGADRLRDEVHSLSANGGDRLRKLVSFFAANGDKLQALLASSGDRLQQMMAFFAAAGDNSKQQLAEAVSEGGERMKQLMAAWAAAAGNRKQAVASGLAAGGDRLQDAMAALAASRDQRLDARGDKLEGVLSTLAAAGGQGLQQMAAAFAAKGDAVQQAMGSVLGRVDNKLDATHSFLTGMKGDDISQVAQQLAELFGSFN